MFGMEHSKQGPDPGLNLLIRYGMGTGGNWVTVNTKPTVCINGSKIGAGTFQGVDWEITGLDRRMREGFYFCTIIFSISG